MTKVTRCCCCCFREDDGRTTEKAKQLLLLLWLEAKKKAKAIAGKESFMVECLEENERGQRKEAKKK